MPWNWRWQACRGLTGRIVNNRASRPHIRLPDIDGLSVCERLANSPDTCDIPVIILSGMERPDIIRRSRAAGCRCFVSKPYDPNALLIFIRHWIGENHGWQPF